MTLTDVLSELNITDSKPLFEDHWDESEASFPDELPRFLRPEMITNTREFGGLPADADAELHQAARLIAESPALVHLAWHCHRLVYEHLDYEAQNLGQWPVLTGALGDLSGAFYLLIGLEAVPRMLATHEPLGIPRQVSRDTFSHYPESTRIYRDQHDGHWGVSPRTLYWLRNHVRGILYRLGRHEYMLKPFHGGLKAYRHRETRNVIALAADGYRYAPDGFVARPDGADTWVAGLTESEGSVTGYPISPSGQAAHREVTLSLDEWELALSPGDYILEMHIPAGGNMTPEACHESMRRALEFFPHYFPKQRFVGFACGSWILNPEITQWYRPDSNMVLWQNELYLFPIPSGDRSGVYFVFGVDEDVDMESAPRDTSLRRAMLDHMASGGRLIGGGMFMLLEDFKAFGSQVYREMWSAIDA